jgi:protein O-GlcNAc transferase
LYNIGALENAKLAKKIYPGWQCHYYCRSDCNADILEKLKKMSHVKVILMDGSPMIPMMWRFIPAFETKQTVIIRDTDSRLNIREKLAVQEWLKSDKNIHIMRDHPYHSIEHAGTKILGGMWGCREGVLNPYREIFYNKAQQDEIYVKDEKLKLYGLDQNFLNDDIYDKIVGDTMIHARYNKYEKWANDFPEISYNGFVGEIFYANDRPSLINRLRMLAYRMKYLLKNKLLGSD